MYLELMPGLRSEYVGNLDALQAQHSQLRAARHFKIPGGGHCGRIGACSRALTVANRKPGDNRNNRQLLGAMH